MMSKIGTILSEISPFKDVTNNQALKDFKNFKDEYKPTDSGVVHYLEKPEKIWLKKQRKYSGKYSYKLPLSMLELDDCLVLDEKILGKTFARCRLHVSQTIYKAKQNTSMRFHTVDDLKNGVVRIYRSFDHVS